MGDLKIAELAPQFAAMLMLDETNSLVGTHFTDFIRDEPDRFQRVVVAEEVEIQPGAVHAVLRDSSGCGFGAEIFYVPFRCASTMRIVVGVREEGEPRTIPEL